MSATQHLAVALGEHIDPALAAYLATAGAAIVIIIVACGLAAAMEWREV